MQDLHATLYSLSLEGRQDRATEENQHMLDLRTTEELLSTLYAGPELWPSDCHS